MFDVRIYRALISMRNKLASALLGNVWRAADLKCDKDMQIALPPDCQPRNMPRSAVILSFPFTKSGRVKPRFESQVHDNRPHHTAADGRFS